MTEDMDLPVGPTCDEFVVGNHGDLVILAFPKLITWIGLDAATAQQMGEAVARQGWAVLTQDDIYGNSPVVIEQIKLRLVDQIRQNIRSKMLHDKLKSENEILYLAEETVEMCLTELAG